jgi:multisubunit Na+/H+ antiporter MnhC subunit
MTNMEPMALIVGVACSLVALVLAWRAYRGASAELEERNREKREREQDHR